MTFSVVSLLLFFLLKKIVINIKINKKITNKCELLKYIRYLYKNNE